MMEKPPDQPARTRLSRRDLLKGGLAASAGALLLRRAPLAGLLGSAGPATADRPYLEAARRAERWIARSAVRGEDGTAWPWDPTDPGAIQLDLYTGMPGVVLFYLELGHATGDQAAIAEAAAGADYLAASLARDDDVADAGLYTGLAGIAYTLALAYRQTQRDGLADAAARALARLRAAAKPEGRGVAWNDSTDIISGSAGIGLFLLWAYEQLGESWAIDLAAAAGRRLIELGVPERGGLKWLIGPGVARNYPNFSHGTAGVSYFLASMHEATGEAAFLDAARAGATYLQALATPTANGGRMIFHSEPDNEQLYYLGWCHGPVGTARLFHRLGQLTDASLYRDYVARLEQAIIDMGVPERSPGFWNNVSQCCGNAGVLEFFLARHSLAGDARQLEFAERVAADTLARATDDGEALKWVQAEHRVRPDLLVAQTGLMQGAAGVGLALLHLDGVREGRRRLVVLPDDPFPA
jgi:lantibiotic modifying enzyme